MNYNNVKSKLIFGNNKITEKMFNLNFEVQNAIFAPRKHPVISLKIK